ncbi:MAG: hypothetical protein R2726_05330 [Acidimicrobiales bacterium]
MAKVVTSTASSGRKRAAVRTSRSMWRRPRATPKAPRANSSDDTTMITGASGSAPAAKSASAALNETVGRSALAHGVPVWADWYSIVGSHHANSSPPAITATAARRAARRTASSGDRRHATPRTTTTAPSSHIDQ